MVEKVAMALCGYDGTTPSMVVQEGADGILHYTFDGPPAPMWTFHVQTARLAIEAMREATEKMYDVGEEATWEPSSDRPYIGYFTLKRVWEVMIEEALR